MADKLQSGMGCVEVEALLAEALDGALHGAKLVSLRGASADAARFAAASIRKLSPACTG